MAIRRNATLILEGIMRPRATIVSGVVLSMVLGSYLNMGMGMDMSAWTEDAGKSEAHACCAVPGDPSEPEGSEDGPSCCALVPGLLGSALLLPPRPQGGMVLYAARGPDALARRPEAGRAIRSRAPPGPSPHFRRLPSSRAPPTA